MSTHKKINGFHPPPGIPREFADQVMQMVWRYNKLIDECGVSQRALRDSQKNYRDLQKKYDDLRQVSESLAEKYEQLLEDGVGAPTASDDEDNSPLSVQDVKAVMKHE